MTDPQADVVKATADAQAARDKLSRDVNALQEKLDPKVISNRAKARLTNTGVSTLETVKRNPKPVTGAAAVLALLVVRKPLARLFRRRPRKTYSDGSAVAISSTSHQSGEGSP